MNILLLTLGLMAAVMAAMAVGVIFGRQALRGSCGGPTLTVDGQPLTCGNCGCGAAEDVTVAEGPSEAQAKTTGEERAA